jgi:hypothetical protein
MLEMAIGCSKFLREDLVGLGHDVKFFESYDDATDEDWGESDLVILHPPKDEYKLFDARLMILRYPGTGMIFVGKPDETTEDRGKTVIVSDGIVFLKKPYFKEDLQEAISTAIELRRS